MSLCVQRLFFWLTTIPLTMALASCFNSEKSSKNNPDFNHNVLFTDYGTYGRTIYFDDNEGETWCYYDVLTIKSYSDLDISISAPIKGDCELNQSVVLSTINTKIISEKKTDKYTTSITTISENINRILYASNGDFSEENTEYRDKSEIYDNYNDLKTEINYEILESFFGKPKSSLVIISLINEKKALKGNIISQTDYFITPKHPAEIIESSWFFSELTFYGGANIPSIPIDIPFPLIAAGSDRTEIYTAHPYQRLTPTEVDPYPLIQIHVE